MMEGKDKFISSTKYIDADHLGNRRIEIFINKKRKRDMEYDYKDDNIKVTTSNKRAKININLKVVKLNSIDYGYKLLKKINDKKNITTDILEIYGNKAPSKELSESASVYRHIANLFCRKLGTEYYNTLSKDPNVLCLVVADGVNPKTGHIFAGMTAWKVSSIDPIMNDKWIENPRHSNLTCIKSLVEDVDFSYIKDHSMVIVVAVHSHANTNELWNRLITYNKPLIYLSVPCCTGFVHKVNDVVPILDINDDTILSDKNNVVVWTTYEKLL
ncbi:Hypothetical protein ORPV_249 [Orpheovirus IHUMI-LCC2]|uniref:Uncharacterized protein n=1 Tax=Orpheovirus IHUMI-LCC2 TaxID=2023057 RepID=A0A2I2L3Q5_9VIRU|nr:Hypothetical protein ORPV_249 [Orpheovirus IHUMI-LCC2]SNW62153.1 Hypothetical protein ORPV_249 [Orpheovirus IHUMI-LCC2]